jgi:single-strand DNA-binding protein
MNSLKNRVTLIGNLGQNPEIKTTETGKKVSNFTIATNGGYKNGDGERISETTWHNIVAWNGLADTAAKYLKKGNEVAVEGRIVYRTYDDKNGVTKYITEIVLNDLVLLRSGKTQNGSEVENAKEKQVK